MELIPKLVDGSIDCCITDPPYGIAYQSAWRIDKQKWKPKILNDETPFTDWIKPLFDKMKDGGRVICFYRWDVQGCLFGCRVYGQKPNRLGQGDARHGRFKRRICTTARTYALRNEGKV